MALVALERYVPEIRVRLMSGWELAEANEPVLRKAVEGRRNAAVKAERLFRQRKALSS